MKLVDDLSPLNLLTEKQRFFADPNHNPQFTYVRDFTCNELQTFGLPEESILHLARAILEKAYFHTSEIELFALEGKQLTQQEVTEQTVEYLRMYHLDKRYEISWSASYTPRTSIGSHRIGFRLPCDFRQEGFMGMLHHEIGTHALRTINYEQQPWYKQKSKFGFSSYLLTEEGLAVLHAQTAHTNQHLYIGALRYLAVWHAQRGSFLDVWNAIAPYVDSLERRWTICVRVKRGLTDTSQLGGFTKDLVYLAGPLMIFDWLEKHNFDITPLYYGKIAAVDVDKALKLNPQFQPLLPRFFSENRAKYAAAIHQIAVANMFAGQQQSTRKNI